MVSRIRDRATYEDLVAVPENMVAELIEGDLYASPRPAGPHTVAASSLGALLMPPFQFGKGGGPGGWWILDEPEVHFAHDVLVPDLGGWRRERMPEIPRDHIFSIAPDWVCEVISPSSKRVDRMRKMPIYARNGVSYAWILDPLEHLLEVRRQHEGQWVLVADYGDGEPVRVAPFEEVEIDLSLIWGPPLVAE
ncbi:MAG TPA: Uma2 family endonuclease [Thermoanaerobaculia bacterium]|nr:Uma2 family endonuclease [Thermoanaerobaculia bacterium]